MQIDFGDFSRDMLIYAFRYTLGRHSYAPSTVIEVLLNNKDIISDGDKQLYIREIKQYFEDVKCREDDFDMRSWMRVVNAFKG